jgi:hypothetical protein
MKPKVFDLLDRGDPFWALDLQILASAEADLGCEERTMKWMCFRLIFVFLVCLIGSPAKAEFLGHGLYGIGAALRQVDPSLGAGSRGAANIPNLADACANTQGVGGLYGGAQAGLGGNNIFNTLPPSPSGTFGPTAAFSAPSGPQGNPAAGGDAARGQALLNNCTECHNGSGIRAPAAANFKITPILPGLASKAFSKIADHSMPPNRTLNPQEERDLLAFFFSFTPQGAQTARTQ